MSSSSKTSIVLHAASLLRAGASVALAVVLVWSLYPSSASAAPSDELSSELDDARAQLVDLTERLENAGAAVEDTEVRLEDTRQQIDELEDDISQGEQKLSSAQEQLTQVIVSNYTSGGVNIFDLIFSSDSFDELASRAFLASRIAAAQSESIARVQELQQDLTARKSELTQQEEHLDDLLSQQKTSEDELEASKAETDAYVDGLSDELRDALSAERAAAAKEASSSQSDATASSDASSHSDNGSTSSNGNTNQDDASSDDRDSDSGSKDTNKGGSDSDATDSGVNSGSGTGSTSGNMTASQRSAVVSAARSQVGVAYDYGAESPGVAFDCSGLTQYAYQCVGISIPRTGTTQYNMVKAAGNLTKDESELQAGDLVFYQTNGRIRHVGIYVGGGQVCHASDYSTGVIITKLHYSSGFCGGGSPV